jgi:hypothetical protein
MMIDTIDAIGLFVEGIITQFVTDYEEDDKAGGDTESQAKDFDERIAKAAADITKGGEQVVAKHAL